MPRKKEHKVPSKQELRRYYEHYGAETAGQCGGCWQSVSEVHSIHWQKRLMAGFLLNGLEGSADILDIGCGDGTDIFMLNVLSGGKHRFMGADLSGNAIRHARREAMRRRCDNVAFEVADAEDCGTLGKFDAIMSSEAIEHLPNPERFISSCHELLRPGGVLVITTPNEAHVLKRLFRCMPQRFRKWVSAEQQWCFERHGMKDYNEEFDAHISLQTPRTIRRLLEDGGFRVERISRTTLIYGGKWLDSIPFLLPLLMLADALIPRRFFPNLGWGMVVKAIKEGDTSG